MAESSARTPNTQTKWVDDPTIGDVLSDLGVDDKDSDYADDLLTAYEDGFSAGFWSEVENAIRFHLR